MNSEFDKDNIKFVEKNTNLKIYENKEIIRYTFYELRIEENLSEQQMYNFIAIAKTRLENIGYKLYRTGQKYYYDFKEQIVKDNELLIAIKKEKVKR